MKEIHIRIKDRIASYDLSEGHVICDNNDYTIVFDFDEEWESYPLRTARFVTGGAYSDVPFSGTRCDMPKMENTELCAVGVYAGDLRTTTPAMIPCQKSIRSVGQVSLPAPGDEIYDQILEQVNAAAVKLWYPSVSEAGVLSFARSSELKEPTPADLVAAIQSSEAYVQAAAVIETNDTQRGTAEKARQTAESERAAAEAARAKAENTRKTDENTRRSQEADRKVREEARISAEQNRVQAEYGRGNAEKNRVNSEAARQNAENARQTAEKTRESQENARQTAETSRESQEKERETRETARQTADEARQSAESSRVTAESARAVAETKRQANESARQNAESARAAAEKIRQEGYALKESVANKTPLLNDASTDAQYPTAHAVHAALAKKADVDGYYATLGAGTAEQLISPDGTDDTALFLERTTAGGRSISSGTATILSLEGKSLLWNQQIDKSKFPTTTEKISGVTFTNNGDGSFTLKGKASGEIWYPLQADIPVVPGHKMLFCGCPAGGSETTYSVWLSDETLDIGNGILYTAANSTTTVKIHVISGSVLLSRKFCPQLFDLTLMFGAGREPVSVDEFRQIFSQGTYEYCQRKLITSHPHAMRTVGINLLDAEKVLPAQGWLKQNDGNWYTSASAGMNGKVLWENTCGYTGRMVVHYQKKQDSDRNSALHLRYIYSDGSSVVGGADSYGTDFVTINAESAQGKTVHQIIWSYSIGAQVWLKDVCVSFLWSGAREGTYEPFSEHVLTLPTQTYFPDGMRGIGTLSDTMDFAKHKAVTRIGALSWNGTEAWSVSESPAGFSLSVPDRQPGESCPYLCSHDLFSSTSAQSGLVFAAEQPVITFVAPSVAESLNDWKQYLAAQHAAGTPVTLYYALAEPTEADIPAGTNNVYIVDDWGTESWIHDASAMAAPVRVTLRYQRNLVDQVRTLDRNFLSTGSSLDSLLAAIGTAMGGTLSKKYAEETKTWSFAFTANAAKAASRVSKAVE